MEKIASFNVNHLVLLPGLYVSRKDKVGEEVITTFDLRMTRPNFEPVMNTAEVHPAGIYLRTYCIVPHVFPKVLLLQSEDSLCSAWFLLRWLFCLNPDVLHLFFLLPSISSCARPPVCAVFF